MNPRTMVGVLCMTIVMALPAMAGGRTELQQYFNDTAIKVKATDNPIEKRQILNESFGTMLTSLDMLQNSALMSQDDGIGIARFKANIQEKQNELTGTSGYAPVPDKQLNAFADYVVQDSEQAVEMITISVVTLLLIIIVVILIAR
jgi:hypothetical protein